jgi:hypothetical protein
MRSAQYFTILTICFWLQAGPSVFYFNTADNQGEKSLILYIYWGDINPKMLKILIQILSFGMDYQKALMIPMELDINSLRIYHLNSIYLLCLLFCSK